MKQQRLLKLFVIFLIPFTLLALLLAAASLAGPTTTERSHPEILPDDASGNLSIIARRAISIPFIVDNDALPPSADGQLIARRAISIPFIIDNDALPPSADGQLIAGRAISIPFIIIANLPQYLSI